MARSAQRERTGSGRGMVIAEVSDRPMPTLRRNRTPAALPSPGRVRLVLALALGLTGVGSVPARAAAVAPVAQGGGPAQIEPLRAEVERLEPQVQAARAVQLQKEQLAAQGAAEIERLKNQPQSVPRDLALQNRLAQAQVQAGALSQHAEVVRRLESELRAARQRLVTACDQVLDGPGAALSSAQRMPILRLRTAQAEALGQDGAALGATAQAVRSAIKTAAQAEGSATSDDPQLLRDRADLLRDSADKLKREVLRLHARRDELDRRQRLRERAVRVDEDLFAEQATSRRAQNRGGSGGSGFLATAGGGPEKAAAPGAAGATTDADVAGRPTGATDGSSLAGAGSRSGLDPSTLDAVLRAADGGDPQSRLQYLERAETELTALTDSLLRRASQLDQRAETLRRQK